MEKESCLTCARKDGCIRRSTTIYLLFVATGRDKDVPEARETLNIRKDCENYMRRSGDENNG